MNRVRVLILGGTSESFELAELLGRESRCEPTLSLAGVTTTPRLPSIPYRSGGFGGVAALAHYLQQERIGLLISATHPFAAQMRQHAIAAARAVTCPLLLVERRGWTARPGDRWVQVPDMHSAAAALGPAPRRVFLTIGRKELAAFAVQPQHSYLVRTIEPPPSAHLPPRAEVILARGPFTEADERRLLSRHRIELLVTKNSGGAATDAKLHAARHCGIEVIMVERPPLPSLSGLEAHVAGTVGEAAEYLHQRFFCTHRVV